MSESTEDTVAGRKIVEVRAMTSDELEAEGWETDSIVTVLVLDDDSLIYASRDDEGNGPGTMFGRNADGSSTYITPDVKL